MGIHTPLLKLGLKVHSDCLDALPPQVAIKFRAPSIIGKIELKSNLQIGAYSYFDTGRVGSLYSVGNYCSIAPGCTIGNGNHPMNYLSTHPIAFKCAGSFNFDSRMRDYAGGIARTAEVVKSAPVIGNDVWVGGNVTILRGVTIGNGAIIGANSLVNKDVPPFAIYAGSPAKLIRFRFEEEMMKRLLSICWWDYDLTYTNALDWSNPEAAMNDLEKVIQSKSIPTIEESRPYQLYRKQQAS